MRFVLKYPTRRRPKLFCATLKKWREMLSKRNPVRFVVSIDEDDTLMNSPIMHSFLNRQRDLTWHIGQSKTKIQAVNADLDKLGDYEVLVLMSDDMIPVLKGYDEVIAQNMRRCFPSLDGMLHFDDGFNQNGLNTLPIMGRKLVERWGHIYHPSYISEFCDNDSQEVALKEQCSVKIDRCIIKHEWDRLTGRDDTFKKNSGLYDVDRANFEKRKAAGFPA
jgi:hypothetical protein